MTFEITAAFIVQLLATIVVVMIQGAVHSEKLTRLKEDMAEIKKQLGNGESEGIFYRRDLATEFISRVDVEFGKLWKKIGELDTEIEILKQLIIQRGARRGR